MEASSLFLKLYNSFKHLQFKDKFSNQIQLANWYIQRVDTRKQAK